MVAVALLALASGATAFAATGRSTGADPGASAPVPRPATSEPLRDLTPAPNGTAGPNEAENAPAAEIGRLQVMPAVEMVPSLPRIAGEASRQPDLYAAEFVRRLLTQDYSRPRDELLAWVQGESATTTDPLVVGMVPPDLRHKLAVFSATDNGAEPAPVPNARDWASLALQKATTRVVIDRVEEPFAWTNAVSAGRVTDPGITARDVSATVSRTTDVDGRRHTSTFSVGITMNLEGPPSRSTWGCVAVISYTAVQVS